MGDPKLTIDIQSEVLVMAEFIHKIHTDTFLEYAQKKSAHFVACKVLQVNVKLISVKRGGGFAGEEA